MSVAWAPLRHPHRTDGRSVSGAARKRTGRTNGRRTGFTLVECLASLLLIAIVLPAVMHGISIASSSASASRRRTEAAALASTKLNELVATNTWQSGSLSGDFGDEFPGYQWSAEVQDWPQEADLQQLDVHVTWGMGPAQRSVTLTTLVYSNAPVGVEAPQPVNNAPKRGPGTNSPLGGGLP